MSDNLLEMEWLPGVGTFILNVIVGRECWALRGGKGGRVGGGGVAHLAIEAQGGGPPPAAPSHAPTPPPAPPRPTQPHPRAVYIVLAIAPISHGCMHTIEKWLGQLSPAYRGWRRWVQRAISNTIVMVPSLGFAVLFPGNSGIVLTVIGATGVAMCSYILPVLLHFMLFFGW